MSSQQFSQEIKQDIQNIRRNEQLNQQQTIVSQETKVITSTEQSIAQDLPIVTERVVTKEYVPVTYEKIIQKIPVVVGQRVETGAPISQEKYVQGLSVEFVENAQQARVDLTPQMSLQSTGVQQVINQPLNMGAERISQQVFTEAQTQQMLNQQLQNQQFQNQQFQNQQFQNQQFQNQQFQNQQFGSGILEAQHSQPGQVFGQQGFVGQPLQQGGLGQQGLLGRAEQAVAQKEQNLLGQQGRFGQQGGLGQQGLLGRTEQTVIQKEQTFQQGGFNQQGGFGQQGGLGQQGLLGQQGGLGQQGVLGQPGVLGRTEQNIAQKGRNLEGDLTNIERNLNRKI